MLKKIHILIVFLLAAVVIRHLLLYPASPDSYLHFGIGRFIVSHLSIPGHYDLSYKVVDKNMEIYPHSWASDILLYLFAGTGTTVITILLLFPLFLIAAYFCYKTLASFRISVTSQIISAVLFSLLLMTYWRAHPLLFAAVLTAAIVYVTTSNLGRKVKYYALAGLFILYANLAGGYVLLALIYLAVRIFAGLLTAIVRSITEDKKAKKQRDSTHITLKESATEFALGAGASLINPFGFRILTYPFLLSDLIKRKWFATLPGILSAINSNIAKSNISSILYSLFLIYCLVLIIILLILLLRKQQVFYTANRLLPLVVFLSYGFFWVRFIPISVAGSVVLFAYLLDEIKTSVRLPARFIKYVSYGIAIGVIITAEYFTFFPVQLNSIDLPKHSIHFTKSGPFQPRFLSSPEYAGFSYFAFYPQKGFLDAQDDLFDENETIGLYTYAETIPKDFIDNLVDKNRVNTIVSAKSAEYLATILSVHPDWELFYLDSDGYVFARKNSLDKQFVKNNALSAIDLNRNLGYDPKNATEAARQLKRFIAANPETDLARGQLASIYRYQHNFQEAEDILNSIPENRRNFVFMTEMGRLKAAEGQCKESEYWLLQAINERHEQNVSRAVLDLAVLYAGCLKDTEKAKHYFKRYNSFQIPPGERQFIQKLMRDFNISIDEQ